MSDPGVDRQVLAEHGDSSPTLENVSLIQMSYVMIVKEDKEMCWRSPTTVSDEEPCTENYSDKV